VILQRLAQATGMRRRSRERQGYGESAHQQQDKQESGGQAMHGDVYETIGGLGEFIHCRRVHG
jgi:hypothetical protein